MSHVRARLTTSKCEEKKEKKGSGTSEFGGQASMPLTPKRQGRTHGDRPGRRVDERERKSDRELHEVGGANDVPGRQLPVNQSTDDERAHGLADAHGHREGQRNVDGAAAVLLKHRDQMKEDARTWSPEADTHRTRPACAFHGQSRPPESDASCAPKATVKETLREIADARGPARERRE